MPTKNEAERIKLGQKLFGFTSNYLLKYAFRQSIGLLNNTCGRFQELLRELFQVKESDSGIIRRKIDDIILRQARLREVTWVAAIYEDLTYHVKVEYFQDLVQLNSFNSSLVTFVESGAKHIAESGAAVVEELAPDSLKASLSQHVNDEVLKYVNRASQSHLEKLDKWYSGQEFKFKLAEDKKNRENVDEVHQVFYPMLLTELIDLYDEAEDDQKEAMRPLVDDIVALQKIPEKAAQINSHIKNNPRLGDIVITAITRVASRSKEMISSKIALIAKIEQLCNTIKWTIKVGKFAIEKIVPFLIAGYGPQ